MFKDDIYFLSLSAPHALDIFFFFCKRSRRYNNNWHYNDASVKVIKKSFKTIFQIRPQIFRQVQDQRMTRASCRFRRAENPISMKIEIL